MKYKLKRVFSHNLTHFSSYKKQSKLTIMNLHFNYNTFSFKSQNFKIRQFKITFAHFEISFLKMLNEIPT